MANIDINPGQTYFFSRSQNSTFIMDSTDHSHALKVFGNDVLVQSNHLYLNEISGFGTSAVQAPYFSIYPSSSTANIPSSLRIGPAYGVGSIDDSSISSLGTRTLNSWGGYMSFQAGRGGYSGLQASFPVNARSCVLAMSGSIGAGRERRLLINAATHYAVRVFDTAGTSEDIEDSDNVIVCNHGSGTIDINLPASADVETGRVIQIINANAGTTEVNGTIYFAGSAIPDTTRTSSTRFAVLTLIYVGSGAYTGWTELNRTGTWS